MAVAALLGAYSVLRHDTTGKDKPAVYGDLRDPDALRKIDPAQVGWRLSGQTALAMQQPRAIAVGPADTLYIAAQDGIFVYDISGNQQAHWELAEPWCLAAAEDGRLFVGLTDRVVVLDGQGLTKASWAGLGERAFLTSIALGPEEVLVADAGNRLLYRFDYSGKLLGSIGQKDPDKSCEGFILPSHHFDVAVGPDGLIRAADTGRHRIEAFTPAGQMEFAWGRFGLDVAGFCGCCNPAAFAILPDGRFVTAEKGLPTVKVYKPDGPPDGRGALESVVAGPGQFKDERTGMLVEDAEKQVLDVAVDSRGRVLVLDPLNRKVRVYEAIGASVQATRKARNGK
jgi:hypothetical protein